MRQFVGILVVLMLIACDAAPPEYYTVPSIKGRVISADGGSVPRARVVVLWKKHYEHEKEEHIFAMTESGADESGRFYFRSRTIDGLDGGARFSQGSPWLLVFRRGYMPVIRENDRKLGGNSTFVPEWRMPVVLTSVDDIGTKSEYFQRVVELFRELEPVLYKKDCKWLAVEKTLVSIRLELRRLSLREGGRDFDPRKILMKINARDECNPASYFPA